MAVIKSVSSRASIAHAINYITKKEKTLDKLITGIECNPRTAINEMKATKRIWEKTDGRQYKHYVQSWHSNDKNKLTLAQFHALTVELCNERFKGFEVVIATHKDRDHIHSHIIVNSVSYEDGHKIQTDNKFLADMKKDSNEQSRKHGLTVPEKGKGKPSINNQAKYRTVEKAEKGNYKSWLHDIFAAVKNALNKTTDRQSFIAELNKNEIHTEWTDTRKHITFTDKEGNKARAANLSKTFGMTELADKGSIETALNANKTRQTIENTGKTAVSQPTAAAPADISPRQQREIAPEQRKSEQPQAFKPFSAPLQAKPGTSPDVAAPSMPQTRAEYEREIAAVKAAQKPSETRPEPPRVSTPTPTAKPQTRAEYEREIAAAKAAAAPPPAAAMPPIDQEQQRLLADYKRQLNEQIEIRKEYKTDLEELSAAFKTRREWQPIIKERPKDNRFWKRDEYDKEHGITAEVIKEYRDARITIDNFFIYNDVKREGFKVNIEIANNDIEITKMENLIEKVDAGEIRVKPKEKSEIDKMLDDDNRLQPEQPTKTKEPGKYEPSIGG